MFCLLSLSEVLTCIEDELDTSFLGIDLQSSIKGLSTLARHTLNLDGFAFEELLVLLFTKLHALYL